MFLGFYGGGAEQVFAELFAERDTFQERFGAPLQWLPNKGRTVFKIVPPPFYSSAGEAHWPEQRAWLVDRMLRIREVFGEAALAALDHHPLFVADSVGLPATSP